MVRYSFDGWSNKEYLESIWKKVRDVGAFTLPAALTWLETQNPFAAFAVGTIGVAVVSVIDYWFSN